MKGMVNYHGTGACNVTKYPTWDGLLLNIKMQKMVAQIKIIDLNIILDSICHRATTEGLCVWIIGRERWKYLDISEEMFC